MSQTPILSINCTDSAGRTGIHLDQRVSENLSIDCMPVVTAVLATRSSKLYRWHPVPPRLVQAQIDAITSQGRPRACKVGVLATGAIAEAVASRIRCRALGPIVLGPTLLPRATDHPTTRRMRHAVRTILAMAAAVVMDIAEASHLIASGSSTLSLTEAAHALADQGPQAGLLTSRDFAGDAGCILWTPSGTRTLDAIFSPHTDARTACDALSAAVTARLALGDSAEQALMNALRLMGCEKTGYNMDDRKGICASDARGRSDGV
ncbi:MAG: bifunctional hydroxymethylpyrimidine kinase/phosphomethylpyrimidine kinase [Armatimonadota bacterium]